MALFESGEIELARTISLLDYSNPFLPERVELEKRALGEEFAGYERFLNVRTDAGARHIEENIRRLVERVGGLTEKLRARLLEGATASAAEKGLYEDLAFFYLYHVTHHQFREGIARRMAGDGAVMKAGFFESFQKDARHLLEVPGVTLNDPIAPEHLFAFFFQLNRAFVNIYHCIVGGSLAAARLRGAIWQSIFTHDLRRYRRALYDKLGDVATLVTGPSGTGKELVARAVGLSRYIPFDPQRRAFAEDFAGSFHALNLSAMSPTLIESELFGHRRGAFTGALEDRVGWFEACSALGAVFLDEIGELDAAIQVKLLRVLQTRSFQRLGENGTRSFLGKVIAATNKDLGRALRDGTFREDLYYRLCADQIAAPSLNEQLAGDRGELENLVRFISRRMAGDEAEALTQEVVAFVESDLGLDYPWPGNFRELEQCVRNVLIRKAYRPLARDSAARAELRLLDDVALGRLSADELLARYCVHVQRQTRNISETARRLGLDRRTVRERLKSAEDGVLADEEG